MVRKKAPFEPIRVQTDRRGRKERKYESLHSVNEKLKECTRLFTRRGLVKAMKKRWSSSSCKPKRRKDPIGEAILRLSKYKRTKTNHTEKPEESTNE